MSQAYELLETLQEDVIAILKAVPDLDAANIISEQNGDLESEVERILGLTKTGTGGKRGLALIVMMPEVTEAESNLPGPPFLIRQEIQVIEHPRINRTAAGTNLRSSHAALLAMNALHLHSTGNHTMFAEDKPITPLPAKDGLVSHVVAVTARANGLAGPGKVAAIHPDLDEETGYLRITGTLVPDATGDLMPAPASGGKSKWTSDGEVSSDATFPWISVYWDPDEDVWNFGRFEDGTGTVFQIWSSDEDVATPDLVTTWTRSGQPTAPTGTPSMEIVTDFITLTCATVGASIYYTTDGTYPTPDNGTLYTTPIAAPELGTTIRAAGYKTGLNPGDCLEFTLVDRTPDGTINDGDLALADADGTILTDL